jgi:hypothetical protein
MDRKKKYFLYHPTSVRTNGGRALHAMHNRLRERGYEAFFIKRSNEFIPNYHYIDPDAIDDDTRSNDIAVYPEVVDGNPWRFQNVARYVLYFPGQHKTGEKEFHPSEKVFTWSKEYYDAPLLAFQLINAKFFFDEGLPKLQDCYFVHKRGKWREVKEIEGLLEINMDYPKDQKELAYLLKTTGTLYSFDRYSQLNGEALLCGAKVKVVTETGFEDLAPGHGSMGPPHFLAQLLHNFIGITQQMNYTGEIQRYPMILEKFLAERNKTPETPEEYARMQQRIALLREMAED